MKTWKSNLEETKQRYINWWNHKGIILNMWEHFQEGVQPHAEITPPAPAKDLSQKWFDPQWRAEYLDWYVAHSSLKADILPVANTQLGPGSLAAILGGVFEGGEDTIWIHPNPDFTDEIVFNPEHPNWILHKELLKACKAKANGHYFVGMPDLMAKLLGKSESIASVIALEMGTAVRGSPHYHARYAAGLVLVLLLLVINLGIHMPRRRLLEENLPWKTEKFMDAAQVFWCQQQRKRSQKNRRR